MHELLQCDCLEYLRHTSRTWSTIFADPPDNIGLGYLTYHDRMDDDAYLRWLGQLLSTFILRSNTTWLSYNSRWTLGIGGIVSSLLRQYVGKLRARLCVQTFTFGQHNPHDLNNGYRPLLRLRWTNAPLFPDAIRTKSWRQEQGDKRANPAGRVPSDVFDFPRVTGNSKQRRSWHPTQLHEGLVERCIRLTTPPEGWVLDPFAGTGTTLRVCKQIGSPCTLIEIDRKYCELISQEHGLDVRLA